MSKGGVSKRILMVVMAVLGFAINADAGLVAYWSCDDATGSTVLTDEADGANGTLTGSMSFEASGVGSEYGNALLSANRNNYCSAASDPWKLGTGDFTVAGWFKVPGLQARHGNVITVGAWSTGGFEMTLLKDSNVDGIAQGNEGKLQFSVFGGVSTDNKYVMSDSLLVDSQWHWFAGVVSNKTMSLYVDGVLQAGSGVAYAATTTASTNGPTYLDRNMVAWIDDIGIFNTALAGQLNGATLSGGELYNAWTNPIPEPATLLVFACGALAASIRKSNKK
jgi:hypothetical protein